MKAFGFVSNCDLSLSKIKQLQGCDGASFDVPSLTAYIEKQNWGKMGKLFEEKNKNGAFWA